MHMEGSLPQLVLGCRIYSQGGLELHLTLLLPHIVSSPCCEWVGTALCFSGNKCAHPAGSCFHAGQGLSSTRSPPRETKSL